MRPFLQFPQLFFLAPYYVPLLLRLAAAATFAMVAYLRWRRLDVIAATRFPIIRGGAWVAWFAILVDCLVVAGLALGYYTQWAALVGALLAIKSFVWSGRYPKVFPLPRSTALLLLIICLALVFTGAGAFAMDWFGL